MPAKPFVKGSIVQHHLRRRLDGERIEGSVLHSGPLRTRIQWETGEEVCKIDTRSARAWFRVLWEPEEPMRAQWTMSRPRKKFR